MMMVRAASNDVKGVTSFGIESAIGGVVIISLVCVDLSAWLTAAPEVFEYSKYVLITYIFWVARSIWLGSFNMNVDFRAMRNSFGSSLCAGVAKCFISPYYMISLPLAVIEVMDVTIIEMPEFLIISLMTFAGFAVGAGLIAGFAAQLRRLVKSERSMAITNRALASLLVFGGGWIAFC